VNEILEDMLRACALDYGSSWDDNLPYAEFSYNNSHQASIEMAPFEALYGRKCTTPLLWSGVGERSIFGPDIIKDAEEKCRGFVNRSAIEVGVWRFVEGGERGGAIRDDGSTSLPSFRSRNGGETLRAATIHYMATSARLQ
jgi:hypothetical protein